MNFNLFTPTKLLFGCGKLNELGNQALPGKRALLLISNGKSVRTTGTLDRTIEQLGKAGAGYVLCANIHENPSKEVVMEAAAIARENGCDFILALGGGAVLDSAVAVAAMATNPGDLWDYIHGGTGKGMPLATAGIAHRNHCHNLRYRFRNQLLGCNLQPRNEREDRVRLS